MILTGSAECAQRATSNNSATLTCLACLAPMGTLELWVDTRVRRKDRAARGII